MQEALIPRVLKSTCRKFWCLFACKKINFISHFFQILSKHCKLSILAALGMLDLPYQKPYYQLIKNVYAYLHAKTHFFLKTLQRNSKLVVFGHTHLKWQYQFEEIFDVYQQAKKSNFSLFSLRYCKLTILGTLSMLGFANPKWYHQLTENFCFINKQNNNFISQVFLEILQRYENFLFGCFRHACLRKHKMIVSTCRTLRCLSTYQIYTSSFTSFLRYYILKYPEIWLVDSILTHNSRTWILPEI